MNEPWSWFHGWTDRQGIRNHNWLAGSLSPYLVRLPSRRWMKTWIISPAVMPVIGPNCQNLSPTFFLNQPTNQPTIHPCMYAVNAQEESALGSICEFLLPFQKGNWWLDSTTLRLGLGSGAELNEDCSLSSKSCEKSFQVITCYLAVDSILKGIG